VTSVDQTKPQFASRETERLVTLRNRLLAERSIELADLREALAAWTQRHESELPPGVVAGLDESLGMLEVCLSFMGWPAPVTVDKRAKA
jgi:hypothetical protein